MLNTRSNLPCTSVDQRRMPSTACASTPRDCSASSTLAARVQRHLARRWKAHQHSRDATEGARVGGAGAISPMPPPRSRCARFMRPRRCRPRPSSAAGRRRAARRPARRAGRPRRRPPPVIDAPRVRIERASAFASAPAIGASPAGADLGQDSAHRRWTAPPRIVEQVAGARSNDAAGTPPPGACRPSRRARRRTPPRVPGMVAVVVDQDHRRRRASGRSLASWLEAAADPGENAPAPRDRGVVDAELPAHRRPRPTRSASLCSPAGPGVAQRLPSGRHRVKCMRAPLAHVVGAHVGVGMEAVGDHVARRGLGQRAATSSSSIHSTARP